MRNQTVRAIDKPDKRFWWSRKGHVSPLVGGSKYWRSLMFGVINTRALQKGDGLRYTTWKRDKRIT